jgi:hypothetical protein
MFYERAGCIGIGKEGAMSIDEHRRQAEEREAALECTRNLSQDFIQSPPFVPADEEARIPLRVVAESRTLCGDKVSDKPASIGRAI